jgi:hypothetical protein
MLSVEAARAEALFTSPVRTGTRLTAATISTAVAGTVHRYRAAGCAEQVAFAFGSDPVYAAPRMRWALGEVRALYPRHPRSARRPS